MEKHRAGISPLSRSLWRSLSSFLVIDEARFHQALALDVLSEAILDQAAVALDSENDVRDVCEAQLPVVRVLVLPFTTSTIISSEKMSKLSPNALGFRLK